MQEKLVKIKMSDAERARQYRARKTDYTEYLREDANRKKAARTNRTEKMDKETERLRIREYRKRKSTEYLEKLSTTTPAAGPAILTAYKSARSLGKAVAHSRRHLPYSPRKAKEVVRNLASSYQLINPTRKAAETFKIPVETTDAVKLFYCKDSISRQSPGRKDAIVIRNEDGTKEYYQKRHMLRGGPFNTGRGGVWFFSLIKLFFSFQQENITFSFSPSKNKQFFS